MRELKRLLETLRELEYKWDFARPTMKDYYAKEIKECKAHIKKLAKEYPEANKQFARLAFKAV